MTYKDAIKQAHYPVDDGFCSCGVFCETGTRYRQHVQDCVGALKAEREQLRAESNEVNPYLE